jgi:hypothetical protein
MAMDNVHASRAGHQQMQGGWRPDAGLVETLWRSRPAPRSRLPPLYRSETQ